MMKAVTVRQVGSSVSATIPREMAERLHLEAGDKVFVIETEEGVLISPHSPVLERGMQAYERIARRDREALRELSR